MAEAGLRSSPVPTPKLAPGGVATATPAPQGWDPEEGVIRTDPWQSGEDARGSEHCSSILKNEEKFSERQRKQNSLGGKRQGERNVHGAGRSGGRGVSCSRNEGRDWHRAVIWGQNAAPQC